MFQDTKKPHRFSLQTMEVQVITVQVPEVKKKP